LILAGDIGGTKTTIALYEAEGDGLSARRLASYVSHDWPGLTPILRDFLNGETRAVESACFGIAGPVIHNRVHTPNLAWTVDGDVVAGELGIARVEIINDLVATAHGIPLLAPSELATLNCGSPDAAGNAALIAAGTGLGMTVLARVQGELVPLPSEGGHQDFAPRNEDERALHRWLDGCFGHVSDERVVSGLGLHNLYDYLRSTGRFPESDALRAAITAGDPGRVIGEAGVAGTDALAAAAVYLFASLYGAVAGNLALVALATGGFYIGGGIAPKILVGDLREVFMQGFVAKGRFEGLLRGIPVHIILNPQAAVLGAALRAARRPGGA